MRAASKRLSSIPMIPAIRRIVVFPYHMRKFIAATSVLAQPVETRKRMGSCVQPSDMKMEFIGPLSEKSVKKSMANAEAMIRLGI